MKLELESSMADLASGRSYGPGVAEVPDHLGKEWIRCGVAKPVKRGRRTAESASRAAAEKAVME